MIKNILVVLYIYIYVYVKHGMLNCKRAAIEKVLGRFESMKS